MVLIAFLISLNIIFVRFFAIQLLPTLRITFGFVPIVLLGLLFGPIPAAIAAGLADFIGAVVFPTGGAYFPGFTISSLLTGFIYGKCLYQKSFNVWRIVLANFLVILFVQLLLNSLWLTLLYDKAFIALITSKTVKSLLMLPIESLIIVTLQKYLYPQVVRYAAT